MLELNPLIIPTKTEYLISQFKIPSNAKTCSRRANLHYCNCNYIMLQIKLNHQRPDSWDEATWFKCQSGQLEIELSQDRVCSKGNAIGWKSATLEQRKEFLFYYGISRLYSAGRDCQCKHSPVFVSTTPPPLAISPARTLGKCSVSLILNGMDTNNIQSETSHFTSVTFSTLERGESDQLRNEWNDLCFFPR